MRRKRKKKIGISLLLLLASIFPAAQAAKKKAEPDSYAVVTGTVFRDPGFALPNALVILTAGPRQEVPAKAKRIQTVCNSRGEFAFRLPPVNARYNIKASAKGFQDEEKSIAVQGEDHVEVTFSLHPESK